MVEWSILNYLPQSKKEYELLISDLAIVGQETRRELLTLENKSTLGFIAPKGVVISEESGNVKFQSLFNFSIPLYERADTARALLGTLRLSDIRWVNLIKSFSVYANENGIPKSWGELLLILKHSESLGVLQEDDHKKIIFQNETENRALLGFEVQAKVCKLVQRSFTVNKISTRQTRDLEKVSTKRVNLIGINSSLLNNEKEEFNINYDGLKISLDATSRYNKYSKVITAVSSNKTSIQLDGTRIKRAPKNTIKAKVSIVNGKYNVRLDDLYEYLNTVRKTTIKITLYKSIPLWFDKKIQTFTFSLDSKTTNFETQINRLKSKKAYVKYEISREGEFFNTSYSSSIESDEI
jgi:hypothetical protein